MFWANLQEHGVVYMQSSGKHLTWLWKNHKFYNTLAKIISCDTPQSMKRQDKGPNEHDENYIPSRLGWKM